MVPDALVVTQPLPGIDSILPAVVVAGSGPVELAVTGRNFTAQSEVLTDSTPVTTEYVSGTQLRATLPNQFDAATLSVQVRTPDPLNVGQHLVSNAANLVVEAAVVPSVSFEPAPIMLPPDATPHDVTLRLSRADFRDHEVNFSITDPSRATVYPTTVTIAAGETSARVAVTPVATGITTLVAQSATLGTATVALHVTVDVEGVGTTYAAPVGVVVEVGTVVETYTPVASRLVGVIVGESGGGGAGTAVTTSFVSPAVGVVVGDGEGGTTSPRYDGTLVSPVVGVTVGAQTTTPEAARMDAVTPAVGLVVGAGAHHQSQNAWFRGATGNVIVSGVGLEGVVAAEAVPNEGVVFGAPLVLSGGTQLTIGITIAPDAPLSQRRLRLTTAADELAWVDAARALFVVSPVAP